MHCVSKTTVVNWPLSMHLARPWSAEMSIYLQCKIASVVLYTKATHCWHEVFSDLETHSSQLLSTENKTYRIYYFLDFSEPCKVYRSQVFFRTMAMTPQGKWSRNFPEQAGLGLKQWQTPIDSTWERIRRGHPVPFNSSFSGTLSLLPLQITSYNLYYILM